MGPYRGMKSSTKPEGLLLAPQNLCRPELWCLALSTISLPTGLPDVVDQIYLAMLSQDYIDAHGKPKRVASKSIRYPHFSQTT